MTPRRLAALQSTILDRIKSADPTWTDAALADAMGCDRSIVSRYRSGERKMHVDELAGLLAAGADPALVLAPLAAIGGARVEAVEVEPTADGLQLQAAKLVALGAEFCAAVAIAEADGKITHDEAADLDRRHQQLLAETRRMALRVTA